MAGSGEGAALSGLYTSSGSRLQALPFNSVSVSVFPLLSPPFLSFSLVPCPFHGLHFWVPLASYLNFY